MIKQKFSILWVEDKGRILNMYEKGLKDFFEEEYPEFELDLVKDTEGTKWDSNLKDHDFDLIVTDYNLNGITGLEILKKLRRKRYLTDVLFYSGLKLDANTIADATKKGFVEIVTNKDLVLDRVKKLIEKNMNRYEDIVFLRGIVISRMIDLELEINNIFASYFRVHQDVKEKFHNFILESQQNSMGAKVKTIECIVKEHKLNDFQSLSSDLKKLVMYRNYLAHCKTDEDNYKILISMGEKQEFDKKRVKKIIDLINATSERFEEFSKKIL